MGRANQSPALPQVESTDQVETLNVETPAAVVIGGDLFNASLAALATAIDALNISKTDSKPLREAASNAERAVAWAAFDELFAMNDPDAATDHAEALATAIAEAKGLEGKSLDAMRQRGRLLIRFRTEVNDGGKEHVLTKGAHKGETVNPRLKVNPFSIAKREYENRAKRAAEVAETAPYIAEADRLAALSLGVTDGEFAMNIGDPGKVGTEARDMRDVKLAVVKARANALNVIREAVGYLETEDGLLVAAGMVAERIAELFPAPPVEEPPVETAE